MVKDISANKRYELGQQVAAAERKLEELNAKEKRVTQDIDNFETSMDGSFAKITEINTGLVSQGSRIAKADLDKSQEMQRFIKNLVTQQREETSESYAELRRETIDEIDSVKRKRAALPWEESKKDTKEK